VALGAENVPAISYFLDRKELLLESSLPLFEVAKFKITSGKALESVRNPKTIILLLAIFARSSKMKQHLLHHSSLNDTYLGGLWNLHLNEIYTLMFPPETEPEASPSSRLSAILFQYNIEQTYYEVSIYKTLRFIQMYRTLIDNGLRYSPALDQTHLDLYFVDFLESGNILAARKLARHSAQLTLQAENVRGDLVLEMYQSISWRNFMKNVFEAETFDYGREQLPELFWDINWVFGGRFDLSYLDHYEGFEKKVDDMSFWNTG
jgi:hypothetical protein